MRGTTTAKSMAFKALDDAEVEGDVKTAAAFAKSKSAFEVALLSLTGEKWRVKPGRDTLSLTSPDGKAIDIYWDWDPLFEKAKVTIEGPKRYRRVEMLSLKKLGTLSQGGVGAKTALGILGQIVTHLGEMAEDIVKDYVAFLIREDVVFDVVAILDEARARPSEGSIELYLSDPKVGARVFGVEFASTGSLQSRAEEVAYLMGWEEGKSGRKMAMVAPLIAWAKTKRFGQVKLDYEAGKKDGASEKREILNFTEGHKAAAYAKSPATASEVSYSNHPVHRGSKQNKVARKAFNKAVRSSKKKEIDARLRDEDVIGAVEILIAEGVETIDLGASDLIERVGAERVTALINAVIDAAGVVGSDADAIRDMLKKARPGHPKQQRGDHGVLGQERPGETLDLNRLHTMNRLFQKHGNTLSSALARLISATVMTVGEDLDESNVSTPLTSEERVALSIVARQGPIPSKYVSKNAAVIKGLVDRGLVSWEKTFDGRNLRVTPRGRDALAEEALDGENRVEEEVDEIRSILDEAVKLSKSQETWLKGVFESDGKNPIPTKTFKALEARGYVEGGKEASFLHTGASGRVYAALTKRGREAAVSLFREEHAQRLRDGEKSERIPRLLKNRGVDV